MIRNPEKLQLVTSVATVVLAALGARARPGRPRRGTRRPAGSPCSAGSSLLVLVATPPWHGIAFARFGDSPVYETLRREATRVLYLPVWPGDSAHSGLYLYAVTRTRVPMINGYSPARAAAVRRRLSSSPLAAMNVGRSRRPARPKALRRLDITHVVVDRAGFPPQVSPYPSAFTVGRLGASGILAPQQVAGPLRALPRHRWRARPRTGKRRRWACSTRRSSRTTRRATVVDTPEASGGRVVAGQPGARGGVPHVRALSAASGRRLCRALSGPRVRSSPRRRERLRRAGPRRARGGSWPRLGRRGPAVPGGPCPAARAPGRVGRAA